MHCGVRGCRSLDSRIAVPCPSDRNALRNPPDNIYQPLALITKMNNWRILSTYVYPHEAHMAKSYLESQGIEVLLKDELTAQVNNFYSNAIGGVKILIPGAEYDHGIEVLKQGGFVLSEDELNEKKIEAVVLTGETDKTKCPYCMSENIGRKKNRISLH